MSAHVGRMEQLQPVVDRTVGEFGRIDVLVNNAGTNFFAPAIEMDEKGWDSVMNTNLKGLFFLSQAAARVMKEKGGGSIVNVASVSGLRAQVPTAHYSIAKAGVIMATKALAVEWAPYGIRVNCVAPGAIDTRLYDAIFSLMPPEEAERRKAEVAGRFPLKRVGQPREIADAILFFAVAGRQLHHRPDSHGRRRGAAGLNSRAAASGLVSAADVRRLSALLIGGAVALAVPRRADAAVTTSWFRLYRALAGATIDRLAARFERHLPHSVDG